MAASLLCSSGYYKYKSVFLLLHTQYLLLEQLATSGNAVGNATAFSFHYQNNNSVPMAGCIENDTRVEEDAFI